MTKENPIADTARDIVRRSEGVLATERSLKMGCWIVDWEKWGFDAATGKISSISWLSLGFTIKAVSFEEAVEAAEREAPKELELLKKRKDLESEFSTTLHYMAYVLGLKDEKGAYHKLRNAHEVFGGQIIERTDYGSSW